MPSKVTLVALIDHLGRGGSERQLFLTMVHLDPQLFERHIVVFNPSPHAVYDDQLRRAGVKVWHLPLHLRTIWQRLRYLTRLLRQLRADIVHSWTIHDNPYAGLAGRLAAIPVRWGSLRGSLAMDGFQALPAYYRYASLRTVSRIVVNASSLQGELEQAGVERARVTLLPNMVVEPDHAVAAADLSDMGITADQRLVGTVGNIRQVKNHALFIAALAEVMVNHADVRGLIVGQPMPGEADLPSRLQAQIDGLGLNDRIILAGFRSDIPELLRRIDIFCLSSRFEGTPNALLEAMAAARPVVATRVGGVPQLISHGQNGLLVPSEDRAALAAAIAQLLAAEDDARRLGRAARQTVLSRHSCRPIVAQLTDLYLQALP